MTNHVFLTGVGGPLIPSPAFGEKGVSPVLRGCKQVFVALCCRPLRSVTKVRSPFLPPLQGEVANEVSRRGETIPPPRGVHPSVPCGDSSPRRGADALPERRRTLFHTFAAIVENFPVHGKLGLDKRGVYRVYSYVARLFPANGEGACG